MLCLERIESYQHLSSTKYLREIERKGEREREREREKERER